MTVRVTVRHADPVDDLANVEVREPTDAKVVASRSKTADGVVGFSVADGTTTLAYQLPPVAGNEAAGPRTYSLPIPSDQEEVEIDAEAVSDKGAPEETEAAAPATGRTQEGGAEPPWVKALTESIARLDQRLAGLEKQSAAVPAREPETDTESATEPTEVGTAAGSAADEAFEIGLSVTEARARFARALRLSADPDSEGALTQPERLLGRLDFVAKLTGRAENRYREIADDPSQQQMPIAAFEALVARNTRPAADVVDEILQEIGSALEEHGTAQEEPERDAYSRLRTALTEEPVARLAEFHPVRETDVRTTRRESPARTGTRNEEVGR